MTRRIFCKVLLVVVAIFGVLVLSSVLSAQGRNEDAFEHVRDVQERNTERLMAMNGVEGTAIGYNQNDQLAVKVFTAGPGVRGIPQQLEDVPVQVVVTGKIYALTTGRYDRPVPIGVSTGHPDITAGTIACRVKDAQGNVYALSNNHVYANSNEASLGDAVIQPGTADGGSSTDDDIGNLSDFEPIEFSRRAKNEIDAAIALSLTSLLGNATLAGGYGTPNSIIVGAVLGQKVQKFGRTTELTTGEVTGVNATVNVGYGPGKTAKFVKQIIIEPGGFSAGGDSGSLIVTNDESCNPVGLLFAGSSTMTVANRIDLVLNRFRVKVDDSAEGPVDNPPTVTITSPADGATVSETVTISADATDDVGVKKVDFYYDSTLIGTVTTSPYSVDWDSSTVTDGACIIKATATDTADQTASDSISVTVDNVNDSPVADAGPDQNVSDADGSGSENVTLDGSGSYDPDGTISAYEWTEDSTVLGITESITVDFSVGVHTVTLTVTDNDGLTDTVAVIITVTKAAAETTMHVGDLDATKDIKGKSGNWEVFVTVTIHDESETHVANATVTGEWSGDITGTVSGITGSGGTVTFTTGTMKGGTSVTFTVNNVTHATLSYDSLANHETSITVNK